MDPGDTYIADDVVQCFLSNGWGNGTGDVGRAIPLRTHALLSHQLVLRHKRPVRLAAKSVKISD